MDPAETAKAHIVPQKSRKRLFVVIGVAILLVICMGIVVALQVATTDEPSANVNSTGASEESATAPAVQDTQESATSVDASSTQLDDSLSDATNALKNEPDYQKVGE